MGFFYSSGCFETQLSHQDSLVLDFVWRIHVVGCGNVLCITSVESTWRSQTTCWVSLIFRKKVPATDLHQVLDIRKIGAVLGDQKCSVQGVSRFEGPFDWAVYTLDAHPGWSAFLSPSIAFGILAHKRM